MSDECIPHYFNAIRCDHKMVRSIYTLAFGLHVINMNVDMVCLSSSGHTLPPV